MIRIILFTLVVASVTTTHGAAVQQENVIGVAPANESLRLIYIGSSKKLVPEGGNGVAANTRESLYFLSQNAAGHEKANEDCREQLGEGSSLVSIETVEEMRNLTEFLEGSGDSGTLYWTSGAYKPDTKEFQWGTGAKLNPAGPWDARHPNSRTQRTRVAVYTVGSPKLRTYFNTVSHRYLCEVGQEQPGELAEPCYTDNDLVIVVDSSGSIGQDKYVTALDFAANLASTWVDNPNNRISVIIYSSGVQVIIGLNEVGLNVEEIRKKVYNAPYLGGGTDSDKGINEAVAQFQKSARSVPKNMVFMTDGASGNPSATLKAAQDAKAAGVRAFSVGIGSGISTAELLAIADNNQDRIFNTSGFEDLLKLLQPVSRRVCS